MSLTAPESELSLEDNVVGFYNTLEYQQRSLIAETIRNTLEGFRDVVINGNDVVPVLDPFVIDHIGPFLYTNTGYVSYTILVRAVLHCAVCPIRTRENTDTPDRV